MAFWGLQEKRGKTVAGTDVCIDNIEKKKIKLLIVATDASDKTKKNMNYICKDNDTCIIEYGLIDEISKSIGSNNKAIVGIKDKNFANEIYKIISGGEDLWGK